VIFNERLVDIASQYLKKGSKVFVKGKIKTRKWQDNNGNDKYTTEIVLEQFRGEIVMLGEPKNNSIQTARVQKAYAPSGSSPRRGNLPVNEDLDDSIPF
jgi:single-strand DNA-binding protein